MCFCVITGAIYFICVWVSHFVFCVFPVCYCLVVSTSAIDYLERLVSEMTCYVSSRTLNHTHLLFVFKKNGRICNLLYSELALSGHISVLSR